jgi:hypothetical protein
MDMMTLAMAKPKIVDFAKIYVPMDVDSTPVNLNDALLSVVQDSVLSGEIEILYFHDPEGTLRKEMTTNKVLVGKVGCNNGDDNIHIYTPMHYSIAHKTGYPISEVSFSFMTQLSGTILDVKGYFKFATNDSDVVCFWCKVTPFWG